MKELHMTKILDDTEVPATACLACNAIMDRAMSLKKGTRPKPNDITLCIECGHIMAFTSDLRMRALTDDEMLKVAGHPLIIRAQKARAMVVKK